MNHWKKYFPQKLHKKRIFGLFPQKNIQISAPIWKLSYTPHVNQLYIDEKRRWCSSTMVPTQTPNLTSYRTQHSQCRRLETDPTEFSARNNSENCVKGAHSKQGQSLNYWHNLGARKFKQPFYKKKRYLLANFKKKLQTTKLQNFFKKTHTSRHKFQKILKNPQNCQKMRIPKNITRNRMISTKPKKFQTFAQQYRFIEKS